MLTDALIWLEFYISLCILSPSCFWDLLPRKFSRMDGPLKDAERNANELDLIRRYFPAGATFLPPQATIDCSQRLTHYHHLFSFCASIRLASPCTLPEIRTPVLPNGYQCSHLTDRTRRPLPHVQQNLNRNRSIWFQTCPACFTHHRVCCGGRKNKFIVHLRQDNQWMQAQLCLNLYSVCVCVCVCARSCHCVRLFTTPWTVAHQAPLSMGILQARILEWVAFSSSRGSPQPRNQNCVSCVSCIGR